MSKDTAALPKITNTKFDPDTQTLLEPVTNGPLKFKSIRTGAMYVAGPEHTLLASDSEGQVDIMSKYKNTLKNTAYEPINPRMALPCPKCKRKITSYQRLGGEKKLIHVCLCGNIWT